AASTAAITVVSSTCSSALTVSRPLRALTSTPVTPGSCATASRTDASHPPQLIPVTTYSLVRIIVLLLISWCCHSSCTETLYPYRLCFTGWILSIRDVLRCPKDQPAAREAPPGHERQYRARPLQPSAVNAGVTMNRLTRLTRLPLGAAVGALALTSCAGTGDDDAAPDPSTTQREAAADASNPEAGAHDHDPDGGPAPEGLQEATEPRYAVGETVILHTDHMPDRHSVV